MSWLWLAAAIICEVAATLSLRMSSTSGHRRWLVPVVLGYALAFGSLALALAEGMAIGVAYGIWSATGVALVALAARVIWKDPLTRRMLLGLVLIMAGVVLVELGAPH